jgi:DNA repair protein RecN (Recombination protein N)
MALAGFHRESPTSVLPSPRMLRYLTIRNLAVIDEIEVEFEAGLNVLTGETGAGKSILVEAVGLLLGGRASSELVRTGTDAARAQALFDPAGTEVIVRREVTSQGRSRAFVDGVLATAAALRELAERLLELHGQHEHQVLLDPESHLDLLDGYASLGETRDEVARQFARVGQLRAELEALRLDERQKTARVDLLTFQRDEIDRAAARPGEDGVLTATKRVLANAERLQRLSADAYALLYDADGAVLPALTNVWRRLAELSAVDSRATPYLEARDGIKSQLEDLAFFLRSYAEDVEVSPERLQETEDRLALLERLKRKYGPTLDDVLAHAERCRHDLDALTTADATAETLERELADASSAYLAAARALSAARRVAASDFGPAVEAAVSRLAMGQTRFAVRFEPAVEDDARWTERGIDRAEFLVSPNPGEDLRPLARIASGGELSRIMLALRTLTADAGPPRTLIFDEVDAGIGGRAAESVGRMLKELGHRHQVLCITHLPQIAACGDVHFRVRKELRGDRTVTLVDRLDAATRLEELGRMMAGGVATPAVLASAADLLSRAGEESGRGAKGEGERRKRKAKGRT